MLQWNGVNCDNQLMKEILVPVLGVCTIIRIGNLIYQHLALEGKVQCLALLKVLRELDQKWKREYGLMKLTLHLFVQFQPQLKNEKTVEVSWPRSPWQKRNKKLLTDLYLRSKRSKVDNSPCFMEFQRIQYSVWNMQKIIQDAALLRNLKIQSKGQRKYNRLQICIMTSLSQSNSQIHSNKEAILTLKYQNMHVIIIQLKKNLRRISLNQLKNRSLDLCLKSKKNRSRVMHLKLRKNRRPMLLAWFVIIKIQKKRRRKKRAKTENKDNIKKVMQTNSQISSENRQYKKLKI